LRDEQIEKLQQINRFITVKIRFQVSWRRSQKRSITMERRQESSHRARRWWNTVAQVLWRINEEAPLALDKLAFKSNYRF
jgi:hypothetical protein